MEKHRRPCSRPGPCATAAHRCTLSSFQERGSPERQESDLPIPVHCIDVAVSTVDNDLGVSSEVYKTERSDYIDENLVLIIALLYLSLRLGKISSR